MQTNRNNVGALIGGAILIGIGLLTLVATVLSSGTTMSFGWPGILATSRSAKNA